MDAPYELLETLEPGIARVLAHNPSAFTFYGTQTYLVGDAEVAVVDPGPDLPEHLDALVDAIAGRPIVAIMCTHTHRDHSPAARPLAERTGTKIIGCAPLALETVGPRADAAFDGDYSPDRMLTDGESIEVDGEPAVAVAKRRFRGARARALFAGLAAHSTLRLDVRPSAAVGLLLGTLAHGVGWPFVRGGASRLADALAAELTTRGGEILAGHPVSSLASLPSARSILCDVTPRQLMAIAGPRLSASYRAALARYRYGPGVFKLDWALSDPIPWRASACRLAGTVHVGGTLEEIASAEAAAWGGTIAERPFVLVTQPTVADSSRAPVGRHVAWGYCHIPHGSTVDMTARVERQVERFAPGFCDTILARHAAAPGDLERSNPNLVGGDIGGGAMDLGQVFMRPTWRGYRTSAPGLYLCSSSTPPGGGVHGMCGYHAAQTALKKGTGVFFRNA